jgi:hypothetical protein
LVLERKPEDGNTLEHFPLVLVAMVPFPYGAGVERTGTTVAVLRMVVISAADDETAWLLPRAELIAPDEPEPEPVPAAAAAVSVTVTVERATVTVTGTQPAAPVPEAAPRAADPEAEEAGTTVM